MAPYPDQQVSILLATPRVILVLSVEHTTIYSIVSPVWLEFRISMKMAKLYTLNQQSGLNPVLTFLILAKRLVWCVWKEFRGTVNTVYTINK